MSVRSTYGKTQTMKGKFVYPAGIAITQPGKDKSLIRWLKHKPFRTASIALAYSTEFRSRFDRMVKLGKQKNALCICGHNQDQHEKGEGCYGHIYGMPCLCMEFMWVWSPEGVAWAQEKARMDRILLRG